MSSIPYLIQGANLKCDKGSLSSKLLLPVGHGFLCKDQPVMLETDCLVMVNILPFGVCSITGGPCVPSIIGQWMKPYTQTQTNGLSAITTDSFLICAQAGLIKPEDSGQ